MNPVVSVIIPAAGSGTRFKETARQSLVPKLYVRIGNQPLLTYVLKAFDELDSICEIIVAVDASGRSRFKREILSEVQFRRPVLLVKGGRTRSESVWNALKRVSRVSRYVCIHDAARPLVHAHWLEELLRNLDGWDGVVLGRRVVPTVKMFEPATGEVKQTLDRTKLFEAETPQLVNKEMLIKSYRALGLGRAFQATDDVSLIEAAGGRIKAVPHAEPNPKVTTYQDLVFVKELMGKNQKSGAAHRFGLGFDRHRLVAKRPFYLGGVKLAASFGPLGHSDGDALLHAITDAILGAVGAGDIGDFFPDSNRRWKGVRSRVFLDRALDMAAKSGFKPEQVDATIILERPKLGLHKKKIQSRVAQFLSLAPNQVSIKAKTAEGFGPEGLGEAVSCQALVVLGSND